MSLNEQNVFLLICSRNLHIPSNKPCRVAVLWHTGGPYYRHYPNLIRRNADTRPRAQPDTFVTICTRSSARFSKLTSRRRLLQSCSAEVPGYDLRYNSCRDVTSLATAAGKCFEISRMSQVTRHTAARASNTSSHKFSRSASLPCITHYEFLPPLPTSTKTQTVASFLAFVNLMFIGPCIIAIVDE